MMQKTLLPSYLEKTLWKSGLTVAGVDEAGRGPLAGPVVAAAVILNRDDTVCGLDDSKKLTALQRSRVFRQLKDKAMCIGVSYVSPALIDRINIHRSTHVAMRRALRKLHLKPGFVLVDGFCIPRLAFEQKSVIHGDSLIACIAAASVVAKVVRDRMMEKLHLRFPHYGFLRNKGYGTTEHIHALRRFGATPFHRKTFAPVREVLRTDAGH